MIEFQLVKNPKVVNTGEDTHRPCLVVLEDLMVVKIVSITQWTLVAVESVLDLPLLMLLLVGGRPLSPSSQSLC